MKVEEGRRYSAWHPNVVVKIPVVPEGLEAMSRLAAEKIRVNATLIKDWARYRELRQLEDLAGVRHEA